MKRFAATFLAVFIAVEAFLALGGYQLLFFARQPYVAGAVCALIIAIVCHAFITQQEAIDELKKQVQELKQDKEA